MRGGYPVRVVHTTHCQKIDGYRDPDPTFPNGWKPVKSWWNVQAGMAGDCGHHHRTEETASRCLEPMKRKYIRVRWPKRKR